MSDHYGPDGDYWADREPERDPDPWPCENRTCTSSRSGKRQYFDGSPPFTVGPDAGFWPPIQVCGVCFEELTGESPEEYEEPEPIVGPFEAPF